MTSIYLSAVLQGAILGLGLAFLVGPAFFALLQASINYGFQVSVAIALGVVTSDVVLMTISYLTMSTLTQIPGFNLGLSLVGGAVLIGSGIIAIVKPTEAKKDTSWSIRDVGKLFVKGFAINTFNPFPWMFWLSTSALVATDFGNEGKLPPFLFFAAAAITVLGTDVLKAWVAQFLLRFLTPTILVYFRWVSGICLAGFGVKLIWSAFM